MFHRRLFQVLAISITLLASACAIDPSDAADSGGSPDALRRDPVHASEADAMADRLQLPASIHPEACSLGACRSECKAEGCFTGFCVEEPPAVCECFGVGGGPC